MEWPAAQYSKGLVVLVAGVATVATGLMVMYGWVARVPALLVWSPDWVSMVFNTALGFALLGLGMLFGLMRRTGLMLVAGLLLFILSLAVTLQFILGVNLGVDELFVPAWTSDHNLYPGRMAVHTCVLFLVAASVLIVGGTRRFRRWRGFYAWVVGVMIAAAGLASTVAYLAGFSAITSLAGLTLMAAHTSAAFFVGGIGLAALGPRWSPDITDNRERWAGVLLALLLVVTGFNLWQGLAGYQVQQVRVATEQAAEGLSRQVESSRVQYVQALQRMARRLEAAGSSATLDDWAGDAALYLEGYPGIRTLSYVAPDGRLARIVSRDPDGEDPEDDRFVVDETRTALLVQAVDQMSFIASGPVALRLGGRGALLLTPFHSPEGPAVILAGVEYGALFDHMLSGLVPGYSVTVRIGGEVVYASSSGARVPRGIQSREIVVDATGPDWHIEIWPQEVILAAARGPLPLAVLFLSLAAAVLVAVAMHFSGLARRRLAEVQRTSGRLWEEIQTSAAIWRESQDVLCTIDGQGRFVRVSDAAKPMWGYTPKELEGRPYMELLHPDDRTRSRIEAQAVMDGHPGKAFVNRYIHKDGHEVYVHWESVWSTELGLMVGIARDVTERMRREQALSQSEERLRVAVLQSDRVVCDRDTVTGNCEWIGSTERLFGIPTTELSVVSLDQWLEHIHPDDHARVRSVLSAAMRSGGAFTMEYRFRHGIHEGWVWIEDAGSVDGNRTISVMSDVTARHEVEEALEQRVLERTRDLEIANKEMEAFSYSVSHDLRTPLRAIAGFAELLQEQHGPGLDDTGRHYLQRVVDGATRMSLLIDDLLMLSRVSRQELVRKPVDLSGLAHTVIERLREIEPDREVEVRVDDGLTTTGDPRMLEIVLTNLIENAWKFTGEREGAAIRVEGTDRGLRVVDNGVGFDMQYSDNLFGVFQRLHAVEEFPGTGVGLAIVKRIIERHGGRVWAEAEVGKGATFNIQFGS